MYVSNMKIVVCSVSDFGVFIIYSVYPDQTARHENPLVRLFISENPTCPGLNFYKKPLARDDFPPVPGVGQSDLYSPDV